MSGVAERFQVSVNRAAKNPTQRGKLVRGQLKSLNVLAFFCDHWGSSRLPVGWFDLVEVVDGGFGRRSRDAKSKSNSIEIGEDDLLSYCKIELTRLFLWPASAACELIIVSVTVQRLSVAQRRWSVSRNRLPDFFVISSDPNIRSSASLTEIAYMLRLACKDCSCWHGEVVEVLRKVSTWGPHKANGWWHGG